MKNFSVLIDKYLDNYKGLPYACWQGVILTLLESSVIGIIFFLSIYFVNYLKIDITTSGIIISCYCFGTLIGGGFCGFLSDKFSPKKIAMTNLIIETICIFLLSIIKSPVFLMINLFILGIATYGFMTSINVWMLNQCNQSSLMLTKSISISRIALNIGFSLSGIMIGLLSNNSFNTIFYLYTVILLISILYIMFFTDGSIHNNSVTDLQDTVSKKQIPIIDSKNNKKVICTVAFCLFSVGLIIAQLSSTYPIYIKEIFPTFGLKAVSILFTLDTILIMLFQAPLVNVLSKYNHILMVGFGAFLMGLGMLILRFSFTFYLALISCIIWTTGEMIFIAMAQLVFYNYADKRRKGKNMGLYQSIYASSKIVGPIAGSFIYFYFGGAFVWYFSALIGVICLLTCNYFKKYAQP